VVTSIQTKNASDFPPNNEVNTLATCATDPFYKVVISSSGGIRATVEAMEKFKGHDDIQAAGCGVLGSLCLRNGSNQTLIQQQGGLAAILEAMRMYPLSIAVQSSACDALMNLTYQNASNLCQLKETDDAVALIQHALQRFLPPSCRESASSVLESILE